MAEEKKSGIEPNIAALLAWLFSPIGGVVFYLIEKENRFVRFQAAQSIVFGVIGWILSAISCGILGIAYIVIIILMMIKSYKNEDYKMPLIGNWTEKLFKFEA